MKHYFTLGLCNIEHNIHYSNIHPFDGAVIALAMMFFGAAGKEAVPPEYFGIAERFSVFAAVGFTAVLGVHLFTGFRETKQNNA